jgi:histidinol-phosphatase (PHP family)
MIHNELAMADYHIHPDFSIDAVGSVDEYCQAALDKGLAEICFTTHYDSNPSGAELERVMRIEGKIVPLSFDAVGKYVDTVRCAQDIYFPKGLAVSCGIEVGYYPGCEKHIENLFGKFAFDYKLAAVHEIDDICLCCQHRFESCLSRYSVDEMADKYFLQVENAVRSRLFDAIAHLDVYKKYGLRYYGDTVLTIHRGRIDPVFSAMVQTGIGIELNTSALRKGHREYYPSMEIINLARQAGVHISAIGSDAHRPDEVGFDFEGAAAVAYELFPYCDE